MGYRLCYFFFREAIKKELGQYPAILTWHLANNPYIIFANIWKSTTILIIVISWHDADIPPPKRTISQDGELRKEYEEELRKVGHTLQPYTKKKYNI